MAVLKDLIVHGPSRFINGIQTESLKADTIDAKNGYFKYLKAIDGDIENLSVEELLAQKATVVGLLDVKGELHTNSWTNSNIANIGGVFYISPTVISTSANVVIGGNEDSRTLTVSGGSFATTTVPTWNGTTESTSGWVIGSRVMVTGSVTYNNVEYPLGTCIGYISGALTSSGFTVQQISSEALESIFAITSTNSLSGTNIQISMYEIGPGNNNNQSNTASYKPVGILMTSYGMADKSTHIDIYGGVNAKNTSSKTSGMADPNVRIGYLSGLDSYTDSAGNTRQPTGWGIYTDNGYFKGVVVADSGSIGHFTIDANSIYSGAHSAFNSNNAGIFLGRPNSSSSDYYIAGGPRDGSTTNPLWYLKSDGSAKIGSMSLSSAGVLTLGSISLSSSGTATIGPWTVNSTSIYRTNSNFANANGMYFGTSGLSLGTAFQVTSAGVLTATEAILKGVTLKDSSGNTKATVSSGGLTMYDGADPVAQFGSTATIGKTSGNNYNIYIDGNAINLRYNANILNQINSSGMTLYDGSGTADTNIIANFGQTISLGKNGSSRIDLNINNFTFYDKNNSPYFKIGQEGTVTQNLLESRTFVADDPNGNSVSYTLTTAEQSNYANGTLTILLSYDRREVINPDYSITGSTLKVSYFSLSDPNYDGDIIIETYSRTSNDTPYLTFGSRKGTIERHSVVMGLNCIASGARSFAIGSNTTASNVDTIAVGNNTTASNSGAFAEGYNTIASGSYSHAAGDDSQAKGYASYAVGGSTLADGYASFAAGEYTEAKYQDQFVIGKYNNNKSTNVFEIGGGTSYVTKNIFEVSNTGNVIDGSGTQLINKAMVACGTTGGVTIGANSTAYIDVSFGKTFLSTPIVVCSIYSTSTAYTDIGKIRCWVTSVSTTGCRIYFYNQASSQRAPAAYWQAIAI